MGILRRPPRLSVRVGHPAGLSDVETELGPARRQTAVRHRPPTIAGLAARLVAVPSSACDDRWMSRQLAAWLGVSVGLLAGCSEPDYVLPDRGTAAVQAEEARLASLLPRTLLHGPGTCRARLLGQDGPSSFAWALCERAPDSGATSGVSLPVRVDGDQVSQALDGSEYAASVKRMFPADLAEVVLSSPERMHP